MLMIFSDGSMVGSMFSSIGDLLVVISMLVMFSDESVGSMIGSKSSSSIDEESLVEVIMLRDVSFSNVEFSV